MWYYSTHLVGGLVAILYFPIYWVSNHPNWLSYFSEGFKPPTRHVGRSLTTNWVWPTADRGFTSDVCFFFFGAQSLSQVWSDVCTGSNGYSYIFSSFFGIFRMMSWVNAGNAEHRGVSSEDQLMQRWGFLALQKCRVIAQVIKSPHMGFLSVIALHPKHHVI